MWVEDYVDGPHRRCVCGASQKDGVPFPSMGKQRLDTLLVERGLLATRSKAAASVMAGEVMIGSDGRRASKAGELVEQDVKITLASKPTYVSRGGVKLENALKASGINVHGRRAMDVGASTGGFTDCLLRHGAAEVIALDVAYGQFDYGLRNDERVHVIERTNARALSAQMLPYRPDLVVVDVSFISLKTVMPAVLSSLASEHDVLALIKPQFEVGRERLGKGGVVRQASDRRDALTSVGLAAMGLGAAILGFFSSGLPGPKGNRESFIWLAERGRPGAARTQEDVEEMAKQVER